MTVLKALLAGTLGIIYRALDAVAHFEELSVLAYHSISSDPHEISITPAAFEDQLTTLRQSGYVFVSLGQLADSLEGNARAPRKAVALTFDDGYADFETTALPILERFQAPATIFLIGDEQTARPLLGTSLPLLSPEAIERLKTNPLVTLGYHGKTHANLSRLSGAALADEVAPRFGAQYFAYPGGNYSDIAIAAVEAADYRAAFSIKPTLVTADSNQFLLPRTVVTKGSDIRFAVSRAAAWYRAIARSLK